MKIQVAKELRFKVGDEVRCPKTLYGETEGKVVEVVKMFQKIKPNGEFDPDGLTTFEHTIQHIQIPYDFDGETLKVHFPESKIKLTHGTLIEDAHTEVSKFYGWGCTVQTPKIRTLFNQTTLRKKQ